nr:hypothetical protein [Tanacetum cinerariifolium]
MNYCGKIITKLAKRMGLLTDAVLNSMTALTYCKALDATTLRELIDSEGRLIDEDPTPRVPRVAMPRGLRPSMQDLYDKMGNMEIRQGTLERMARRELMHHLGMMRRSRRIRSGVEMTLLDFVTVRISHVEARLVEFKTQEIKFCEKIRGLKFDVESKNNKIEYLMTELEKEVRELIRTKRVLDIVLFPPPTLVYSPSKKDMSWTGLLEFADDTITDYSGHVPSIESNTSDLQNTDSLTVIKTNKIKTARKPPVKYAEMYRNTSKSPKVRGNQRN